MRPYYIREYNRFVRHLIATEPDYEAAMARAVGGSYDEMGMCGRRLLEALGLQDTHYVIDIGAGSGRLASALKDLPKLRYLGTDVVSELLEFAQKKCGRDDWSFELVDEIEDALGDSLCRHYRHEQTTQLQMDLGAILYRDQRIDSFLDTVVNEFVRTS